MNEDQIKRFIRLGIFLVGWTTLSYPIAWLYVQVWRWRPDPDSIYKKIRLFSLISLCSLYSSYWVFHFTGLAQKIAVNHPEAVDSWKFFFGYGGLLFFGFVWWILRQSKDQFLEQIGRRATTFNIKVEHENYLTEEAKEKKLTYLGFAPDLDAPIYLNPIERNGHVHILGSTGSGKTRYVIFPMMQQDIELGHGVIFIDAKGSLENAKAVYKMVCDFGGQEDFLFFSLTHPELSNTYNPLQNGNYTQLKDKIAGAIEWSEPFYQRVCEEGLQILLKEFSNSGEIVTLPKLYQALKKPPVRFKDFYDFVERNKKHTATLQSEIGLLVDAPFSRLFDTTKPEINLLDVYLNRRIVYFSLDTQTYQSTAMRLGKMITQDLNTLSGIVETRFDEKDKQVLCVWIDEFQSFGTKAFINALARGRSSKFWISVAHQSIGDLKAIDPAFSQQVIDNTNTKIFLRLQDSESAQVFADSLGTQKTIEYTKQVHFEGEVPQNIMGSQKVVDEYKIHPTEIKELQVGQAVFKSPGQWGKLLLPGYFEKADDVKLPQPHERKEENVHQVKPDSESGEIV
jgi:hypothetical protein